MNPALPNQASVQHCFYEFLFNGPILTTTRLIDYASTNPVFTVNTVVAADTANAGVGAVVVAAAAGDVIYDGGGLADTTDVIDAVADLIISVKAVSTGIIQMMSTNFNRILKYEVFLRIH